MCASWNEYLTSYCSFHDHCAPALTILLQKLPYRMVIALKYYLNFAAEQPHGFETVVALFSHAFATVVPVTPHIQE